MSAQRRIVGGAVFTVIILLCAYFTYHAMYGNQGLRRQQQLQAEVERKEAELVKLKAEREAMDKRTHGLRPETLDADMLEEQARKQLGYTKDGEKVILTTP